MSFKTISSINYGQRAARLGDTAFDNAIIFPEYRIYTVGLPQELSSPCGTFPCGVGHCKTCKFIDSSTTISAPTHPPISSTVYHAVDVACFTLEKLEDV